MFFQDLPTRSRAIPAMLGIPRGYQAQDGKVTMEELYEALKDHLDQVPEDLGDRLGTGWAPWGSWGPAGDRGNRPVSRNI